jgi:plastocyanin
MNVRARRFFALSAVVAWAAAGGGCEQGAEAGQDAEGTGKERPVAVVEMTPANTFEPRVVTIRVGQTVLWRNASSRPHTVSTDAAGAANPRNAEVPPPARPFSSGDVPPGGTYAQTFTVPGFYRYYCAHHEREGMTGTVAVMAAE